MLHRLPLGQQTLGNALADHGARVTLSRKLCRLRLRLQVLAHAVLGQALRQHALLPIVALLQLADYVLAPHDYVLALLLLLLLVLEQ